MKVGFPHSITHGTVPFENCSPQLQGSASGLLFGENCPRRIRLWALNHLSPYKKDA